MDSSEDRIKELDNKIMNHRAKANGGDPSAPLQPKIPFNSYPITKRAEPVKPNWQSEIQRLALLPAIEYELQRRDSAKKLGVNLSGRTGLDRTVAIKRTQLELAGMVSTV